MASKDISNKIKEFVLLDLRGNEVVQNDPVVIATGSSYSAYLTIGLIKEIRLCPKTVRVYLKKLYGTHEYSSYISLDYNSSGKISNVFLKLDNLIFDVDKQNFAKLLQLQNDAEKKDNVENSK